MTQNSEIAPLYQKVKSYVSEKIFSGELRPNSKVPSEHELVRKLGVSRMTANRALKELAAEGLLTRVPGVGTFVIQTQTTGHLLQVRSIAEEVRGRDHVYGFEVLANGKIKAPIEVAQWMKIPARDKVFHTVVLHKENDMPIQLEDRYINPINVPTYAEINLTETTPSEFLLANVPLQRVDHTVQSIMPSDEMLEKLGMGQNIPCLVLERKTWSQGKPISFVMLYHPGDKYALSDTFSPMRK